MDEQAREDFRSYVVARSPALLRTAYMLTGNRADAEDLLQAGLAKTYLAWDRIREREAVDGYARGRDGAPRWGVAQESEGGPEFVVDEPLGEGKAALPAVVAGTDAPRLLLVAAPSAGAALYAGDGSAYAPMRDVAPGVFVTAVDGDPAVDRYKLLDGDGNLDRPVEVGEVPAPRGA